MPLWKALYIVIFRGLSRVVRIARSALFGDRRVADLEFRLDVLENQNTDLEFRLDELENQNADLQVRLDVLENQNTILQIRLNVLEMRV